MEQDSGSVSRRKLQDENQVKGRYGELLAAFVFPHAWVVRPIPDDFGLDLELEIFHEVDSRPNGVRRYQTRGEHLYMQVKTTDSLSMVKLERPGSAGPIDVATFQMQTADLKLVEHMGASVPVVLLLVDRRVNEIFYVCLTDYVSHYLNEHSPEWSAQETVTVRIPARNKLTTSGNHDELAEHWSYFSRLAGRSKLYSAFNLIHWSSTELKYKVPVLDGDLEADKDSMLRFMETFARHIAEIKRLDVWPNPEERAWGGLRNAVDMIDRLEIWCKDFHQRLKESSPDDPDLVNQLHWEPQHNLGIFEALDATSRIYHTIARIERLPMVDPFSDSDMAQYA